MMGLLFIPMVFGLALYFVPTMIGFRKRNAGAIFALNLFLGWTLVGWVVSLVWALTKEETQNTLVVAPWSTQSTPAWTCSNCRAAVGNHSTFCGSCGTKTAAPESNRPC
jgi:hypothetical protein